MTKLNNSNNIPHDNHKVKTLSNLERYGQGKCNESETLSIKKQNNKCMTFMVNSLKFVR